MSWLEGWSYRKPVTLSRASGAVTNYQMKLLVGESSGAAGEDVDCGGLCAADFDDLRFTAADGTTLLDYWIESVSGATPNQLATVWIEFDSIGTGATTFYMYYGNSGAAAASNGDNTFLLFDDFNDGSIDGAKWSNPGTFSEGSGVLSKAANNTNTNYSLLSVNSFTAPIAIKTRAKVGSDWANEYGWGNVVAFESAWATNGFLAGHYKDAGNDYYGLIEFPGGTSNTTNESITADTWYDYELRVIAADQKFLVNGVQKGTRTITPLPVNPQKVSLACQRASANSDYTSYFDWVFVRSLLSTEPAWGAWGESEEEDIASVNLGLPALALKAWGISAAQIFNVPLGVAGLDFKAFGIGMERFHVFMGTPRISTRKPAAMVSAVNPGFVLTLPTKPRSNASASSPGFTLAPSKKPRATISLEND
ncbi:MAG: hypothetical protein A2Z04_04435 [Chloroflexi bacterium RBG_16_57_9]|nr:MAG: hypothetical protein A2Z04_04435 [Chloroflexi bacterium RBG_16_57_9]